MRRQTMQLLTLLFLSIVVITQTGCGNMKSTAAPGALKTGDSDPTNPLDPQDPDNPYNPPDGGDEDDDQDNDDDDGDNGGGGTADDDQDADGVVDSEDNCVTVFNPNQKDFNNDGYGDACDPDLDDDLDVDDFDYDIFVDAYYYQDLIADFDGDGDVDDDDYAIFIEFYENQMPPGPCGGCGGGGGGSHPPDRNETLIYDTFDRGNALQLPYNDPIWEQMIYDNGSGAHVNTALYRSGEIVDTVSGSNAIFFKGRQGHSRHKLFLTADPVDASGFESIKMSMTYMPIDLEGDEYIRVEYCILPAGQCDPHDPGLWGVMYQSSPTENYELGRMNNYNALDFQWFIGEAELDLALLSVGTKRSLQFRIVVFLDEGIKCPSNHWPYPGESFTVEDGVAVDTFLVKGVRY